MFSDHYVPLRRMFAARRPDELNSRPGDRAANILIWAWFSEPHGYDFHGTLVRHEEGHLCIDPVEPHCLRGAEL